MSHCVFWEHGGPDLGVHSCCATDTSNPRIRTSPLGLRGHLSCSSLSPLLKELHMLAVKLMWAESTPVWPGHSREAGKTRVCKAEALGSFIDKGQLRAHLFSVAGQ